MAILLKILKDHDLTLHIYQYVRNYLLFCIICPHIFQIFDQYVQLQEFKDQIVTIVGDENITLYGKNYSTVHYKLKSKDDTLPNDKKLDFDIWLDKESNLILKVVYKRMGDWEYRLKNFQ